MSLAGQCVAIQLPIGAESDFKGVIDLITMKAKGPDDQEIEIPADLVDQVRVLRDAMAEAVAECDDDLTMKYLEGEELTEEELVQGLAEGVKSGAIVPGYGGCGPVQHLCEGDNGQHQRLHALPHRKGRCDR